MLEKGGVSSTTHHHHHNDHNHNDTGGRSPPSFHMDPLLVYLQCLRVLNACHHMKPTLFVGAVMVIN
jgi:hypothetical protein